MHWIERALANVNIEALNDILIWTTRMFRGFNLNIGSGKSFFEKIFPVLEADTNVMKPILLLAIFIVVAGTMLKLWITIMSPFDTAEAPGAIIIRTTAATIGVVYARELFYFIERRFNDIYVQFKKIYTVFSTQYKDSPFGQAPRTTEEAGSEYSKLNDLAGSDQAASNAFNFLGGEHLIKQSGNLADGTPLGLLIIELVIGIALIICFFRLGIEVYERYVLLGVMYITSPLAFASLIQKDSAIFRNWFQMLISQYILLCMNMVFIGGFMGAYYNLVTAGFDNGYMFESPQAYLSTMFALIAWLIIGQKADEHLRSLGLSVSQTGSSVGGAILASAGAARMLVGAAGAAGGAVQDVATGQTKVQKAWQAGKEGRGGGLIGMLARTSPASPASASKGVKGTGNDFKPSSLAETAQDYQNQNQNQLQNANTAVGGATQTNRGGINSRNTQKGGTGPKVTNAAPINPSLIKGGGEAQANAAKNNQAILNATSSAIKDKDGSIQQAINSNNISPLVEAFDPGEVKGIQTETLADGSTRSYVESNGIGIEYYSSFDAAVANRPGTISTPSDGAGGNLAMHIEVKDPEIARGALERAKAKN